MKNSPQRKSPKLTNPKVCFVVQRYGPDISGGAEWHCRMVVEKLKDYWDIAVATTCAKEYTTWSNKYAEGEDTVNGVKVNRFRTDHPRPRWWFDRCYDLIVRIEVWETYSKRWLKQFTQPKKTSLPNPGISQQDIAKSQSWWRNILKGIAILLLRYSGGRTLLEHLWMKLQGPSSKDLNRFIKDNHNQYDLFVFFSYGYATTFHGLKEVAHKSLLVPTAHDDPALNLGLYKGFFKKVRGFVFNTKEEQQLITSRFDLHQDFTSDIVGVGVDEDAANQALENNTTLDLPEQFALYVGRIEPSKGCDQMFEYFEQYKKNHPDSNMKLVVIGSAHMPIPDNESIIPLGFVSDEIKWKVLAKASVLIMPSPYESLSVVLLESWWVSTPVLVNGHCSVLAGQTSRSNGGSIYLDSASFEKCLNHFCSHKSDIEFWGRNGRDFVHLNYRWSQIIKQYKNLADHILTFQNS